MEEQEKKIPEMKMNENKIVLPILDVPIMINGEKKIVKMQKITTGKRREVMKKHVSTSIVGQQMQGSVNDPMGVQISFLSAIIIEAPFGFTEKEISELPEEVVDYLYEQYQNWDKKKQTLED